MLAAVTSLAYRLSLIAGTLCLIFSVAGGCGKSSSLSSPKSDVVSEDSVFFVNGDPRNLIKDTALVNKSFFTTQNIQLLNGFESHSYYFKERVKKESMTTTTAAAQTQDEEVAKQLHRAPLVKYSFSRGKDGDGKSVWIYGSSDPDDPKFYFYPSHDNANQLEIKSWRWPDEEEFPIDILHYSLKADGSAFSILFLDHFSELKGDLIEFAFSSPNSESNEPLTASDQKYNYIFSKDAKVRWRQSEAVPVVICGSQSKRFRSPINDAFENWQTVLEGRLRMSLTISDKKCPPFSDLNFVGVYFVDDYSPYENGVTLPIGSRFSRRIVDGDIFIYLAKYKKDWKKDGLDDSDPSVTDSFYIYRTLTHEIGHLLGLDHKFDGTSSIMSYSNRRRFSIYDKNAIQTLYPKLPL